MFIARGMTYSISNSEFPSGNLKKLKYPVASSTTLLPGYFSIPWNDSFVVLWKQSEVVVIYSSE